MPSEEIRKDPNWDDSANPGSTRQLVRLEVWWDLKHYRRYCRSTMGWPVPVGMCLCFPVAIDAQNRKAYIQSPFAITETEYLNAIKFAKENHYYAEVRWADKDPDINKWESELIQEFGYKAMVNEDGKLITNIIGVPDRVKRRFKRE